MNESTFITAHRQAIAEHAQFLHTPITAAHYQINRLQENIGNGYIDLYDFGRVILARGDYRFHQPQIIESELALHYCGANILLEGAHHLELENRTYHIPPPQIALRKGTFGKARIHLPADTPIRLISLDFTPELLAQIPSPESNAAAFFQQTERRIDLNAQPAPNLLHHARHILDLPCAQNELDLIRLESAALALLAALLAPPEGTVSHAIAHARELLNTHIIDRLTIAQLARRVGVNECDLKRQFKAQTGMTIGAYAREMRMQHARRLLTQGKTLQQTASLSGYDNLAYFIRLYTRHHGYHPKHHKKQIYS